MDMEMSRVGASFVSKAAESNPMQMLIGIIDSNPDASKDELFALFKEELEQEPAYQRAVEWYFFINMHNNYLSPRKPSRKSPQEREEPPLRALS